ncbi:MAG TPA: hypothetical protein VK122_01785 [Brachybacterium sp.]|nr:hypothetical protein [Brachybacterium sp.]
MSTVNDPENPDRREAAEHPGGEAHPREDPGPTADAASPTGEPSPEELSDMDITSVYVRRRRTPTLGFWVALALIVPAVAALLVSPLFDFADIAGVLNFMLVAAVFVGLPLAAIACVIDAIRHRTPKGPRR